MKIWQLLTQAFALCWSFCSASRLQPSALSVSDADPSERIDVAPGIIPARSVINSGPTLGALVLLQDNVFGRGIVALKEWWASWQSYFVGHFVHGERREVGAGKGRGFMGSGATKNSPLSLSIARAVSVLVASTIPIGALAAGGLLWRFPRTTCRIMIAVLLIALIFLGSAPASMRKGGTTPLIVSIWGLFCMGIYLGAPLAQPEPRSRRSRADVEKEKQLDALWDTFFEACSDRGILELKSGRFSAEEVEGTEPRLLIAVPGLVFLQCALTSIKKKIVSMELPGGTSIAAGACLAEDDKASTGRRQDGVAASSVFSRLSAFDAELRLLAPLTNAEVQFIEARVLQVCPEPLLDIHREAEVNLVAGALISAATEVTQIPAFKKRMGGAMRKMVGQSDSQDETAFVSPQHSLAHCPRSGLPLATRALL